MKLSEKKLRKIIREEINETLSMDAYERMEGLVNRRALKKMEDALTEVVGSLVTEGFHPSEVKEFVVEYIKQDYIFQ